MDTPSTLGRTESGLRSKWRVVHEHVSAPFDPSVRV